MGDALIRQATLDDVPELAKLRREFTFEDPPVGGTRADFEAAFREIVGGGLQDGSWVVWVAESEGRIVGHVFVAVVEKVPRPIETLRRIGYVTNVYTRPDHRGRGVGAKLLTATKEWARQDGIEVLIVWPSERSTTFYHRHGFDSPDVPLVWSHPDAE
jgi:GNAT superfamily N-acetyltransferase